jgi:chemotaxis signal transduction protein
VNAPVPHAPVPHAPGAGADASAGAALVERVLVARVGEERIALDVLALREVLDAPIVTAIPLAPAGVCGQMAYRGGVLTILDPDALFGMPLDGVAGAAVVLMDIPVALAVDDVEDVWTIGPEDRHVVPAGTDRRGVLRALLRRDDRVVAQVDAGALAALAAATLRQEGMR